LPTQYTANQCGQGAAGAACRGCMPGATCDADAGACVGGSGGGAGGGGGGFPGLDGGLPSICDSTTPCPSGECCDSIFGVGTCKAPGATCDLGGAICITLGALGQKCTCQASGPSAGTCAP
jgi:hypothetical protein